jgi:uncharacterized membrane protein YuzA (DUF378 family)
MRKILEKNIPLFFSSIIFGGVLWGLSGLGFILGKNWNIVNLLLGRSRKIEGLVYLLIGLGALAKSAYNMLWDRPKDPPYIVFIIFTVVASGFYWGIIGVGLLFGVNLNLMEILPAENTAVMGIINYSIGLLALIKLFNFIHTKRSAHKAGSI